MRVIWGVIAGAAVLLPSRLVADTCPPPDNGMLRISAGFALTTLPAGTAQLFIFKTGTGRFSANPLSAPTATGWKPTDDDRSQLANALMTGQKEIEFAKADGTLICTRLYQIVPDDGVSNGLPTAAEDAYETAQECEDKAGPRWEAELKKRPTRQRFTLLIFLESSTSGDGSLCYSNRDHGIVGDPIYVGVFRNKLTWISARFEPCALQAAAPNILRSSEQFPTFSQAAEWRLQKFMPRTCFNTAVDVTIVGDNAGKPVSQRFPLAQYDRYRATLQAGILFTPLHDSDFALRADQSDTSKKFIYDKGPVNRGPEYIATLQLYSILRYLPALTGQPAYRGRDPINDQSFTDRLGAILGVGIKNPAKRFVAGLSLELLYGVSAVGVIDFARVTRLASQISTTDPFKGLVADIPTTLSWQHKVTFGLSLDIRYVATLFTGNR